MRKHRILTKDEFELLRDTGLSQTKKYDTIKRLAKRGLVDIVETVGAGQAQVFRYIVTEEGVLEARRSAHAPKGIRHT